MQIKPGKEESYAAYCERNSHDGYSKACTTYARAWADLMEAEIAGGKKLEDVAEETSHRADTEGITGFMYGCAVQDLAHHWVHGDQLRVWHNASYGVNEEKAKGGTVNPAILTIAEE